ncbi:MAG: hypothetical protein HY290_00265 [Planctomycetia bacterium]|nr:hypothetical protein [Planctomycetia bacterium]
MSQRTQLALGLLMTAACLASAVSVWKLTSRDAVPARTDVDAALNARLDRLITTIEAAQKTSDWVNLQIRLVLEQPDGPPAEGFAVEFPEIIVSPGGSLKLVSGPTGVVDLGLVRAGRHSFSVTSPWNTVCGVEFDVRPGSPSQTEVVICPAASPPAGDVTIDVDWPDDLRSANFGLVVTVDSQSQKMHGWEWHDLEAVRCESV